MPCPRSHSADIEGGVHSLCETRAPSKDFQSERSVGAALRVESTRGAGSMWGRRSKEAQLRHPSWTLGGGRQDGNYPSQSISSNLGDLSVAAIEITSVKKQQILQTAKRWAHQSFDLGCPKSISSIARQLVHFSLDIFRMTLAMFGGHSPTEILK